MDEHPKPRLAEPGKAVFNGCACVLHIQKQFSHKEVLAKPRAAFADGRGGRVRYSLSTSSSSFLSARDIWPSTRPSSSTLTVLRARRSRKSCRRPMTPPMPNQTVVTQAMAQGTMKKRKMKNMNYLKWIQQKILPL